MLIVVDAADSVNNDGNDIFDSGGWDGRRGVEEGDRAQ